MIRQKKGSLLRPCLSVVLIAAIFLVATPCLADELSDLKKQVSELEAQFNEEVLFQRDEHTAFLEELDERIKINMYIGLDYESFEQSKDTFIADSLELVSEIPFQNKMSAFFELEFKGGEAEVEQGWFEYLLDPAFNIRFGAILVPFGAYNLNHFNYQRALSHRPLAMKHVVPVTWREAGIGFTGNVFIENNEGKWPEELAIDYQFFLVNGLTEKFEATSSRKARGAFDSDNDNKGVAGRIGFSLNEEMTLGLSAYQGKYDVDSRNTVSGLDLDWDILHEAFEFLGEIARFRLEKAPATLPKKLQGGYAQINYRFWSKYFNKSFFGRGHDDPHLMLVLRFGEAIIEGGFGKNKEVSWTSGINYRPYPTFVARLEYQWNRANKQALEHGNKNGLILSFAAAF